MNHPPSSDTKHLSGTGLPKDASQNHLGRLEEGKEDMLQKNSQPDLEFIASQNWYEGRPKDKIPERRAYHVSFVHDNK
jgi:hypothetical protein